MYTYLVSKIGTILRTSSMLLLTCLTIGMIGTANAVPFPPAGFDPDTGVSYFTPDAEVLGFELFDLLEPATSVGFFYKSDPGTKISLFDSGDPSLGGAPQVTYIDFTQGMVWDVDSGVAVPESFFVPKAEDIGFFLSLGSSTIFSDPLLNGGVDLFSAFPSMTESGKWAFIFEAFDTSGAPTPINITLVSGVSSVPEPSILVLLSLGGFFMLIGSRRRHTI